MSDFSKQKIEALERQVDVIEAEILRLEAQPQKRLLGALEVLKAKIADLKSDS